MPHEYHTAMWRVHRNPQSVSLDLIALRTQALTSLLEMAQWPRGHAYPFLLILGRVAGIAEGRLTQLADDGQVDEILKAISRN